MQYRPRVYGSIYRKIVYLDTQTTEDTSLDRLVEK